MAKVVPQWLFYVTVGILALLGLFFIFVWVGVIGDAHVSISKEGITIFDTRPGDIRGSWQNMSAETVVDAVYTFLVKCIPLDENDKKFMREATIVIVSERRLQVIMLLSRSPQDAVALYDPGWKRIYVVNTGDLAHEFIHHYVAIRRIRIDSKKHHEHLLFQKCQSYDPAISFYPLVY